LPRLPKPELPELEQNATKSTVIGEIWRSTIGKPTDTRAPADLAMVFVHPSGLAIGPGHAIEPASIVSLRSTLVVVLIVPLPAVLTNLAAVARGKSMMQKTLKPRRFHIEGTFAGIIIQARKLLGRG
jgi:hypothetical protein